MSPFNIGDELSEFRSRTLRTPRRRGFRGALVVASIVVVGTVACAVFGTMRWRAPEGRRPLVGTAVSVETVALPKWQELRTPLAVAGRSARQEQSISFSTRKDADPFAPDVPLTQRYPAPPGIGYPEPAEPERLNGVRDILAVLGGAPQPPDLPAPVRETPSAVRAEPPPAEPLPRETLIAPAEEPPPPGGSGVPAVTIAQLAPRDEEERAAPYPQVSREGSTAEVKAEVKGEVRAVDTSGVQEVGAASAGSSDPQASGGAIVQIWIGGEGPREAPGLQESPPPLQQKSATEKNVVDEKAKKPQDVGDPSASGKPSAQSAGAQVAAKPAQQATGAGEAGGAPQQPPASGATGKPPQQLPAGPEVTGKAVSPAPQTSPADDKPVKAPPAEVPKPEIQKPAVTPPLLLLTGVVSSGDLAYAIVRTPAGSSIVRQGDEIEGMTVKSIQGTTVTVMKQGEEFVIELGGGGKR